MPYETNKKFLERDYIGDDPKLRAVLSFAAEAHDGDLRHDGVTKYIEHPKMLCNLLHSFTRSNFLSAVRLPQTGELNSPEGELLRPLMKAIGMPDAKTVHEEAYKHIQGLLKATALMHDVVEENELYRENPASFVERFKEYMHYHCKNPAGQKQSFDNWLDHVCKGVLELSNDTYMYEGKRTWQVEHVQEMTPEFKIIKIYDQAATVTADVMGMDVSKFAVRKDAAIKLAVLSLEDAMHPEDPMVIKTLATLRANPDPTFATIRKCYQNLRDNQAHHADEPALKNARRYLFAAYTMKKDPQVVEAFKKFSGDKSFTRKGLDVSRSVRSDDHQNPCHELFKRMSTYFEKSYNLAQDGQFATAEARREKFSIQHVISATHNTLKHPERRRQVKQEEVEHVLNPTAQNISSGLVRVTMSKKDKNRVVAYSVIVEPEKGDECPANKVASEFCKCLETRTENRFGQAVGRESEVSTVPKHGADKNKLKARGIEEYKGVLPARDFTVTPPPDLKLFLTKAKATNAIDEEFLALMQQRLPKERAKSNGSRKVG